MSSGDGVGAPTVTVGVPVFNGERYLEAALEALRAQTWTDLEVVVSDNASSDRSREIVRDVAGSDPRFRLLTSDVNRGLSRNFNRTLDAARGRLFLWHAADDRAGPEHVARCVEALDGAPDAVVAFSRVAWVDCDDREVGRTDDVHDRLWRASAAARVDMFLGRGMYEAVGYGGMLRTRTLRALGGIGDFYGSDVVLGIRMAMAGRWVQVPEVLFAARKHAGQMSKTQGRDIVDQVRVYRPEWTGQFAFPQWYLERQLLGAAMGGPGGALERTRAVAAVARRWTLPNWRLLPFDLKRNAVHLLRGRYRGAYDAPVRQG